MSKGIINSSFGNGGILRAPKFTPADVIDLSYKRLESLPNRVRIMAVYLKENNDEWQYQVVSETTGKDPIVMSESFIAERMAHKDKKVYTIGQVKKLYNDGFRWAGNYPDFIARDKAVKLAPLDNIESIHLYTAFDTAGGMMNGYLGIWVRYTTVIGDNGIISVYNPLNGDHLPIIIK